MAHLRLDLSPLRELRDFRLLFTAGLVSNLGSMATFVAMPYQVAELTGSYVAVGILGVLEVVPLVVFGLWGGLLADRIDRQRMVFVTEVVFVLLVCVLLVNALRPGGGEVWPVFVVSLLFAAVDGLQRPSLDAIIPRVVPPDRLASAGALVSLRGNIAHVGGPALGGLLIAVGGVQAAYLFDALTFVVSIVLLARVARVPSTREQAGRPVDELREAFRYVRTRRDILGTYLVDTLAMVFAFPYALFPFIAAEYDAPWSLGLLYTSLAVGGLLATVTSGWASRVHHHGRAVIAAAAVWGVAIASSGLVGDIWWVIAWLMVAGAADMVSGLFRSLIWNRTIPDELRGRMAGLELLSYAVGPQVGQVRSTFTAQVTSLRASLVIGGAVCAGSMAVLPSALPELWNFDERRSSPVS